MLFRTSFCCFLAAASVFAQAPDRPAPNRAESYYNFTMGHLYADLAGAYNNKGEYLNKAIDHYRAALKADPGASFIAEELSDLYIQAGRISEAVTDAEAALRADPKDLNARRVLGRIYMRIMGDSQQGKIKENILNKAIEQYAKITEESPKDIEAWLTLGRLYKVAQNSVDSERAFKKALEIDPDSDDATMGLALVYTDLGDPKRASELFRRLADRNPNPRTLAALAAAYEQAKEYAMAAEAYRKALEIAKNNDELKRALAQSLLFADKTDEALKIYEEMAAAEPKDVQAWLRISQIYRQQRKFDKAREASDRAKAADPENLEVLYNEVGIFEVEGKLAEAIKALKTVVDSTVRRSYSAAERQNRALLLERLGLLYRANEQAEQAVEVFRELAALDNAFAARASAQVVDTYRQDRQFKKAEEESDAAFRKWPDDRATRVVRANLLADLGRGEEAVALVKKLFDGKSDRETHLTLVSIYEKLRNFTEMARSIDAAEKLSKENDDKETIYFLRGAMFEKMKKIDQAEAEFKKLLQLNPSSASALNYLGYMYADRNTNLNEAVAMIQKALEQEPANGAFLDSLGWAYYRLGRLEEAEDYLQRAVARASKDATVHDHLGDVYAKRGKLKEAVAEWEIAVRLHHSAAPAEQDAAELAKIQKKLDSGKVRLAKEQGNKK